MPNWCENDITITGKGSDIKDFLLKVKGEGTDISLNKLVPYPKKYTDLDAIAHKWDTDLLNSYEITNLPIREAYAKFVSSHGDRPKNGFNSGGYEWCVQNWGTKWDIKCQVADITTDDYCEVTGFFDSAWSPPLEAFLTGSKKFPTLEFSISYKEEGCGFFGYFECCNGECLCDENGVIN